MKNTDLSRRNLRILILFISFIFLCIMAILYVYVIAPRIGHSDSALFKYIEATIPNLSASLLGVIVLYIMYLMKISPEYELKEAYSDEIRIKEIREGISKIITKLQREEFSPDLIISLTRSGSIIANMIGTQKIENIVCENIVYVPRERKHSDGEKKYVFGILPSEEDTIDIQDWNAVKEYLKDKFETKYNKILFVTLLVNTCDSLLGCFDYFRNVYGVDFRHDYISTSSNDKSIRVATIYLTPDGKENITSMGYSNLLISAYKEDHSAREKLARLPWIIDQYHYI